MPIGSALSAIKRADLASGIVLTLFEAGLMDIDVGNSIRRSPTDFFRKGSDTARGGAGGRVQEARDGARGRIDENEFFAAVDPVERF